MSQHGALRPTGVFIASNSTWSTKAIHNTLWLLSVAKDAIFHWIRFLVVMEVCLSRKSLALHYSSVSTTKAKVLPQKCRVQGTLTISGLSVHTCFDKNARLGALYNSPAGLIRTLPGPPNSFSHDFSAFFLLLLLKTLCGTSSSSAKLDSLKK